MVFSLRHTQVVMDECLVDVLTCKGEIDIYTSPRLKEKAQVLLDDEDVELIELDIRGVRYIDSTGLATMLNIHKQASLLKSSAGGFRIRIGTLNPLIRRIFNVTGLKKKFVLDHSTTGRFPE